MKKVLSLVVLVLMVFTFSFGVIASSESVSGDNGYILVTSNDTDGISILEAPTHGEPTED